MAEPYLLNRFFETPLLITQLPDDRGRDVRVAELVTQNSAGPLDRTDEYVQSVARIALDLAARFTQDVGQKVTSRYRWEWDARTESGAVTTRPGAFWSFLYWPHENRPTRLRFNDPRLPWVQIEEPSLRFRDCVGSEAWQYVNDVELPHGRGVMFPAWLQHQVAEGGSAVRIDLWALLEGEQVG